MKRFLVIILIIMSFGNSIAQKIEIGGEIGYGKTSFSPDIYFKLLSEQSDARNINADINASFKIGKLDFWLITAIGYQQLRENGTQLNYLKVPVGFDITPGRKVKFIIGSGLYIRYLFSASVSESDQYKDFKYDFQFGWYVDTGIKYQLTETWGIYIKLQADIDLTDLYVESLWSHFGSEHQDVRSYSYTLNIGCKYMIH